MIVFCLAVLVALQSYGDEANVIDLKCDYRVTPMAVDSPDPLLSWRMDSEREGAAQQAYRIQASTTPSGFDNPDLWDSGWREGNMSTAIPYTGKLLRSQQRAYWRVQVEDETGTALPWSEPSWFDAGLLEERDWRGAAWISCSRKLQPQYAPAEIMGPWIAPDGKVQGDRLIYSIRFALPDKTIVHAATWWGRTQDGAVWAVVNGETARMSTSANSLHYTDWAFDLKPGDNEVSLVVNKPAPSEPVSFAMDITFADGETQLIQSSADWQASAEESTVGTRVTCPYGEEPLGQAKVHRQAPLPAAWYKRDFTLEKRPASARLYICGLGYNEPYLNGEKVGDHVLDPGQTDYEVFAHYQVFDALKHIKTGTNTLSVLLGDGWYNQDRGFGPADLAYGKPGLRALLDVRFEDGSAETVKTDGRWYWLSLIHI